MAIVVGQGRGQVVRAVVLGMLQDDVHALLVEVGELERHEANIAGSQPFGERGDEWIRYRGDAPSRYSWPLLAA